MTDWSPLHLTGAPARRRAPWLADADCSLYLGDVLVVLREMYDGEADACVTSPPYLDARPEYPSPSLPEFEDIFRELGRVVEGPLLLNVGRLWRGGREVLWWADLLERADMAGWPLADTLVWVKPNANPIQGAVLANSHEYVFLLGDASLFDVDAVRMPYTAAGVARASRRYLSSQGVKGNLNGHQGRVLNDIGARPRSFVAIPTGQHAGNAHPAPMALELADHLVRLSGGRCILDPFAGSGTTLLAARNSGRRSVGIDLNEDYLRLAAKRLAQQSLLAVEAAVLTAPEHRPGAEAT